MPGPITPIIAVPSCPLRLFQYLNGIYYYEVGDCSTSPHTVTGWTQSTTPLTCGCSGTICLQDAAAAAPATPTAAPMPYLKYGVSRRRPAPPGTDPGARRRAKGQLLDMLSRKTGAFPDLAGHRDVRAKDSTANWFELAIDGTESNADWSRAVKEFSTAVADVDLPATVNLNFDTGDGAGVISRPVTQMWRAQDDDSQDMFLSPTDFPVINPAVVQSVQNYATPMVKLPRRSGAVTYDRWFRLFQLVLLPDASVDRQASTLYFGQEIAEPSFAVSEEARLVDRHQNLHVIRHGNGPGAKQFLVSTVEDLLPVSEYV